MFVPLLVLAYDFVTWVMFREATLSRILVAYINFEAHPLMVWIIGWVCGAITAHLIGWTPPSSFYVCSARSFQLTALLLLFCLFQLFILVIFCG